MCVHIHIQIQVYICIVVDFFYRGWKKWRDGVGGTDGVWGGKMVVLVVGAIGKREHSLYFFLFNFFFIVLISF